MKSFVAVAQQIMQEFASDTGLNMELSPPQRYLWTDAFAVCNFLELFRQTQDRRFLEEALHLVHQVHHTLGRHRPDDRRRGWISGLGDEEGRLHPTRGGLRIGKRFNERQEDEPAEERLDWDRDGQYYHYLTKWMHALQCVARVTGDANYLAWALELAQVAHARFSYLPSWGGAKRLYWKMSIDLSRSQVRSMGQHDPLDGLVTYSELQAAITDFGTPLPDLSLEIADMAAICRGKEWNSDDPLGLGGLLWDASRMVQLMTRKAFGYLWLLEDVLDAACYGMGLLATSGALQRAAAQRLAFRELGLSIGLKGVKQLQGWIEEHPGLCGSGSAIPKQVAALGKYLPLADEIESFWLDDTNRAAVSWQEHREINRVMLATSLAPGEFLLV